MGGQYHVTARRNQELALYCTTIYHNQGTTEQAE